MVQNISEQTRIPRSGFSIVTHSLPPERFPRKGINKFNLSPVGLCIDCRERTKDETNLASLKIGLFSRFFLQFHQGLIITILKIIAF